MKILLGFIDGILNSLPLSPQVNVGYYYVMSLYCIKYARIRVFSGLYILRFWPYTGIYGSEKTRILTYFVYTVLP